MTQDVLEHHRAAVERGALCQQCPLYNCGQGPVMGEVRPGSVLTVIGDAPSAYEVEEGKVFLSGAGEVLGGSLLDGGLARNQCTVTNAILCRPPGGDMVAYLAALKAQHKKLTATAKAQKKAAPPPLLTPQACCAPRLQRDIEETGSKTILAVGPEALRVSAHLLKLPYAGQKAPPGTPRVATLKKQHGSPVVAPDGRTLTASLHPNFGLHGSPTYLPIIREDIARAARIALRGGTIDWVEPDFIIKPSLDTCLNVIALLRESKQLVTIDIETDGINVTTAKIRCVGLGAVVDGKELIIVVPLRHMDGRPWWNPGDEQTLSNALMTLLESNPLSGHNLLFDTAVCLQQGLLRNRAKHWFDCYLDDETEFLTDRGWLKYDDVRASDKLATVASDNTLEWQHYQMRVDKRRKGRLLELETAHTRAVVTPGHTIWHQKTRRNGAPTGAWQLTPAERLLKEPGGDAKVLRACRASTDERDWAITDEGIVTTEQAKFYGLAVSDGTIRFHAGRPYRLRVSQKVGGRAYAFLCDFTAFPLEERQYKKKETWRKTPCVESLWEVLGTTGELVAEKFHRWFGRHSVERRLPPWAFAAPPRVRQALLDGLLLGDASEVGKATLYRSFSKHLADDVQALALTLGIPATVNRSGKCWVVNMRLDLSEEVRVVTRESMQSANGFASWRPDDWYRVVCFVVPNHTLVTRSGGRPAFYGNTMLAHHDTNHSELPHDLGFVAARNFEAPRWKDDADQKSVHGVDDYWLHVYCMFRGTPIVMADGSTRLIEDLVRERSTAEVLAVKDGRIVKRAINGWHKQKVPGQKWTQVRIERQRDSARGIVCTPDHELLVADYDEGATQWVQARDVRPGQWLRLPEQTLYVQSRDLLIGTLLGDSSLQFSPAFRDRPQEAPGASIQSGHTEGSQLAQMKRKLLPDLFTHEQLQPGREIEVHGRKGTAGPFLSIWTPQHRQLAELYAKFYDEQGRRRLRVDVLEYLNAAGFAWWFMDDGCRQKGQLRLANTGARGGASHDPDSVVFSTQRYPKEDVEAAAEWFTRRFGSTYACGDGTLRLSYKASAEFAEWIAPYVFPAQRYKLPSGEWPAYDEKKYIGKAFLNVPVYARVASVGEFVPTATMKQRGDADTRYCLDVEDAHNFFTPWGLVHNCAKDVLGEMRLVMPLARQVERDGTIGAFQTDTRLAPIARDMGVLGLNINETRRREFFDILDAKVTEKTVELRRVTGDPDFNPNAFKQVAKFLYLTKGLSPPYATDGREWKELADDDEVDIDTEDPETILAKAATNELSLVRLLELGVDGQTQQFIEAQLQYRGLQKCKATYVGLKYDIDKKTGERGHVIDVHRENGFLQTEEWMGHRLSIFHPSWKLHVTPTGRFATSPNVQNWPERIVYDIPAYRAAEKMRAEEVERFKKARTPEAGILNTRAMVEAPPGHILVGADYAAIELRIYAVQAQDHLLLDAILNGKDPHALNYAVMQSRRPEDLKKWYDRVMTSPPSVKKYLRIIAKRFCIAEGELVLVRREGAVLEVPIEKVEAFDYVWDGVEWVSHDGVIDNGVREVIFHDGLWATADHEVWVEDGRCLQLGEAQRLGLKLARTGEEGRPLRFVGSRDSTEVGGEVSSAEGALREVSDDEGRDAGQPDERKVEGLSEVLPRARRTADVAVCAHERSASALHEPEEQGLAEVRRARHPVSLLVGAGGDTLGVGDLAAEEGAAARPHEQRRALRAGKPAVRERAGVEHESLEHEAASRLDVQAGGVAVRREARQEDAVRGADPSTNSHTREDITSTPRTRVARVYDILNAGPRRRFTAANRLVHNCFLVIYGGQKDKLYKTMAADRNPDGTRSFPDLKPGDVEMWFDNWHRGHPETRRWHESVVRAWSMDGFVATVLDGRRRFFIGGLDPTAMPNMTIQGSAASIANRAMLGVAARCPHRGWSPLSGPVLQVHDFIGLQVPLERQKDAEDVLNEEMPYDVRGMPIIIEQKSGPSWDKT